jgi:glutamate-1-semialdehyde 2,1-aminomutase
VAAGSGVATLGIPGSPGIPKAVAAQTLSLPFNDIKAVEATFTAKGDKIAAIIVEPVCGNMGVVTPKKGFLEALRLLCDAHGALLIFDEVMTGFRLALGGAQQVYGIKPDITCLGKILGGGMPVGAYGGRRDLMEQIAPSGTVYQAGTLSGNPVAMAAGIATLEELTKNPQDFYAALEEKSLRLEQGFAQAARQANLPLCINRAGSMITLFFQAGPVTNFEQAKNSDTKTFGRFFNLMAQGGVSLPPSQFEAWFVCAAHTREQIDATVNAAAKAFKSLA